MIKGIGIDLIDIRRFENIIDKKSFLEQILTKYEIFWTRKNHARDSVYAIIFTIKEAIFKALGCGLHGGSYWKDIEINQTLGLHSFFGFIKRIVQKSTRPKVHISQSCSKRYATSFVLIEE